ncbi:MAG: hypothetical protein RBS13_07115 [Bacteroidales bacterium]|jgi:hypothetical protein|nr:hypothetical protein [Bacteroidales bacterium]
MKQILTYIGVFIIINVVLWGGQELYHYNDNKELEQIESEIASLDIEIKSFESVMDRYGASQKDYNTYTKNIDERNNLVEKYNKLAEDTGSRWYLIPIPMGRTKSIK